MYRQILETIEGVGIYPLISLIIFSLFFAALVVWLLNIDKSYLKRMEQMPFESNEIKKNLKGDNYEI